MIRTLDQVLSDDFSPQDRDDIEQRAAEAFAYEEACKLVLETANPNASFIHRRLHGMRIRMLYTDAVALLRKMETDGLVSAEGIGGKRVVIDTPEARARYQGMEPNAY